jgi:hypothetical protein
MFNRSRMSENTMTGMVNLLFMKNLSFKNKKSPETQSPEDCTLIYFILTPSTRRLLQ